MLFLIKILSKKIALIVLSLFFFTSLAFAKDSNALKMEKITKEIKQKKEGFRALTKEEKELLDSLEDTKQKLNKERRAASKSSKKIKDIEIEIGIINNKIGLLTKKVDRETKYVNGKLRALYKLKILNKNIFLFSPTSLFDFLRKQKNINEIIKKDMVFIEKHIKDREKLAKLKADLKNQKNINVKLINEYDTQRKAILKNKKRVATILGKIKKEKKLIIANITRLEERKKELNKKILSIIKKEKTSQAGFKKISMLKPVKGKIISKFGYKRKDNIKTFQSGIVIKASTGSPIVSATDGRVVFANHLKGYGQVIVVKHPQEFYIIYGYLETMFKKAKEIVKKGEVIATIGNAEYGEESTLYFEVRFKSKPKNPLLFFKK